MADGTLPLRTGRKKLMADLWCGAGAQVIDESPEPGTFTLIETPRAPWWRRLLGRAA